MSSAATVGWRAVTTCCAVVASCAVSIVPLRGLFVRLVVVVRRVVVVLRVVRRVVVEVVLLVVRYDVTSAALPGKYVTGDGLGGRVGLQGTGKS